jgi:hypothetical protein
LQFGDPAGILRIDFDDVMAQAAERISASLPGAQAHGTLGAQTAKEDRNAGHAHASPTPTNTQMSAFSAFIPRVS